MPLLRILGFSLLTLVATTLPATARTVAVAAPKPHKAVAPPHTSTDRLPDKPTGEDAPTVAMFPQADVWDGGTPRTVSVTGGPVPTDSPAAAELARPDPPVFLPTSTRIEAPSGNEPTRRCWLTCLYAHAPPVAG